MSGEDLLSAVYSGNLSEVQSLVRGNKSIVNSKDIDGRTAFLHACSRCYLEIARFLFENGANPLLKARRGNTAFHTAAGSNRPSIVRFLISLKLNPFEKNKLGKTPREFALQYNRNGSHTEVISLLKQYEAEFEEKYGRDTGLNCRDWDEYQRIVVDRDLLETAPFVPLAVGNMVVEGPDWSSERTGKEGEVTELRRGQVKVYWSFFDRSWHAYSERRREVMGKEQVEEVLASERGGKEEEEEEEEERKEREEQARQQRLKQERDEQARQQRLKQEREEQARQQLLHTSSDLQREMMQLVASLRSPELLNQFETGNASTTILIELLEDDCEGDEKEFRKLLKADYELIIAEAKRLSSLIVQLKQAKDQLGSHFEELPFEAPSSSSISSSSVSSSSSPSPASQHTVTIGTFQVAESELNKLQHSGTDKRTHILPAYDTHTRKEIVLKVFEDEASAVQEHGNLDRLRSRQVVAVFGDVSSIAYGGSTYYGVAMERGEEDVRAYIERKQSLSNVARKAIGMEIIQAMQLVNECGLVWHDCKPSNFVRCHVEGDYYVKAIDVEHALAKGSQMTPAHGHTVRFAAPEVVRGCEGLRSDFSMDMWSLGVTLLFVAKGQDLADVLFPSDIGEEGTDRLSRLYSTQSSEDLQRTIDSALDRTFTEQESHLKSLIGHLLRVEASERFSMSQVMSHPFVAGGHGTRTRGQVDLSSRMDRVLDNQDEIKESLEDQSVTMEFMREEMRDQHARTEAAIDSLKTELMTKMASGQLPPDDMMAFTQQLAALQTNPSSDDLQAIKDQLQEIFDRVSEQKN